MLSSLFMSLNINGCLLLAVLFFRVPSRLYYVYAVSGAFAHLVSSIGMALRPHFDSLAYVGYFKPVPKPESQLKQTLHVAYRVVVWILVIAYNLQHVIQVVQVRRSTEQVVNTLFVLLTTLNTLGKQMAFNVRSARIDRLIATMEGPLFATRNEYHVQVMKEHALEMSRLLKLYHFLIYVTGALFAIFPLVDRALGEKVEFTGYFPFETNTTVTFAIALSFNSIVITLQGYGNVTLDCTIVALYAHSKTQLRMLRYSLEHLVDQDWNQVQGNVKDSGVLKTFRDVEDPAFGHLVTRRLVHCVEHYKLAVWFTYEVESIFGEAMVVQFFVMSWVICMTVYKITGVNILSAEFVTLAMYLCCMLAQLFIYCYYGTQIKYESEGINHSMYCCDWVSLSPRLRRLLLVAMGRARSVAPRAAYIIPMSLETYIAVLRLSYTLFTFLERK